MNANDRARESAYETPPSTDTGARLCFESVWERHGRKIAVFPVTSDDPAEDEHGPDEHIFATVESVIEDVRRVR